MTLRIGWLSPFTRRTGVGTFSKALTDAMPATTGEGEAIDLTVVGPISDGLYRTRHRFIDIASTSVDSGFYDLFDVVICNIGNNTEHHNSIIEVLRNKPSVVICHDYVYQHYLATIVYDKGRSFADYVALNARYGGPDAVKVVRRSNVTSGKGLLYAPWDSDFSGHEPLAAPLLQLGSALVVHSAFAERYARDRFQGPILRLGMPHDQRPVSRAGAGAPRRRRGERMTVVSFGHIQSTKCIDDVLRAIAGSDRLRRHLTYVISGFASSRAYLQELRDLAADLDLEECVRFAPDLSDADLDDLTDEAHAFINLRYPNTEGASVSLIEQLVTAKPVIVLDTGCYAEIPDDAVIKVARPRDVNAIREALHRMLASRDGLDAIGQRGREHALRLDCRGYTARLVDFLGREREVLRRRGAVTARCRIGLGSPAVRLDAADDAWSEALATARTSLDLLETGDLAHDPELVQSLSGDRLVDFVQAAILLDGANHRLTAALKALLADRTQVYALTRGLWIVREAIVARSPKALDALPRVFPHDDIPFWTVIESLGPAVLTELCFRVFFGIAPPAADLPEGGTAPRRALEPIRLAEWLAGRDRRDLTAPPKSFDAVLDWLRHMPSGDDPGPLELLPVGRSVTIGSPEQRRYLRLSGFFDEEHDHAWTRADFGLVYVSPAPGTKRIVLSGYNLDGEATVSLSAATGSGTTTPAPMPVGTQLDHFEINLREPVASETVAPVRLSIRLSSCRSPAELGLSCDPRPLGFCLKQIAVS